jgi:hypothetical protein
MEKFGGKVSQGEDTSTCKDLEIGRVAGMLEE